MGPEAANTWAGPFGNEYADRQIPNETGTAGFFARALARMEGPPRVALELGAGTGDNIRALHRLYPNMSAWALEVNSHAASQITGARIIEADLTETEIPLECQPDLVFTRGVLIHIHPARLIQAYRNLAASSRYVLIAEYHNPTPIEVRYRDRDGLLWKRDFAAHFLSMHPEFRVIDYGFAWRHDPHLRQDDLTWFLLERRARTSHATKPDTVRAAFASILQGDDPATGDPSTGNAP